jgi:aconitate hydratase
MNDVQKLLHVADQTYTFYSLQALMSHTGKDCTTFPYSLKILLENLLRHRDGISVTDAQIDALLSWSKDRVPKQDINFYPSRVVMQDFTGVPAVVDLAALREAIVANGGDPRLINPQIPVDLVIDHSVMVDEFGSPAAFQKNVEKEFERNSERYRLLKWAQKVFKNFRVVPPGTGIVHQVNLEYLGQVIWTQGANGKMLAFPDTLVGTDSHTTMINGLAILGWGVGGIEAEAAMLGQAVTMLIPEVVGCELVGELPEGVLATDLVLTVTQKLRQKGVVEKFVEFYGSGLDALTLEDRATISNMAPEYGATCGIFPIDAEVLRYLRFSGRKAAQVNLVEAYAKEQGLWRDASWKPEFNDTLTIDLSQITSSLAGPRRPQDKVVLGDLPASFEQALEKVYKVADKQQTVAVKDHDYALQHGSVVIAAITSCTNTSNPVVLVGAGLIARKARQLGLQTKPWVKTSFAPGSRVVTDYLSKAGLMADLEALGFHLVGYGCTTCIGNSGPLPEHVVQAIHAGNLITANVLSGNRNFEGRINPDSVASYLASPPLVVAYALAGSMLINLRTDPIGKDRDGRDVYLKDLWPSSQEVQQVIARCLTPEMFNAQYADVFTGTPEWQAIPIAESTTYDWEAQSTYIQLPPFFQEFSKKPPALKDVTGARCLAILPDSTTTDHISPAGSIPTKSPAGKYLLAQGVTETDFNSFGSRRGNHEVMMRGTFGNIRIKNQMLPGVEGGLTKLPNGEVVSIYDAAVYYADQKIPLIVLAGREYGTGSSRDWAAKGAFLLGVKAVIAESYERIHRSNLIGMGVLPLEFPAGVSWKSLQLNGEETYDLQGIGGLKPRSSINFSIHRPNGETLTVPLNVCIDTETEWEYYRHSGILPYVLRNKMA